MGRPPIIDFKNLTVTRNGKAVIHRLALRIKPGEHAVILGPNGAGKSTLLKIITRELYPLKVKGARWQLWGKARWSVEDLRKWMGIVSEEIQALLDSRLPLWEGVASAWRGTAGFWNSKPLNAGEKRSAMK